MFLRNSKLRSRERKRNIVVIKSMSSGVNTRKVKNPKKGDRDNNSTLLFSLPDDVVFAEMVQRPSRRNRSPYVADVLLLDGGKGKNNQREAIAHVPSLDMGGKCIPGTRLVLKVARDKKGNAVGKDAVSAKYGTPKCEFITQLVRVDDTSLGYKNACWIGAHPSLGERIAEQLIKGNHLGSDFPKVKSYRREVVNPGGANMRADFVVEHEDPSLPLRVVEVKTVADTDYSASLKLPDRMKCLYVNNDTKPYRRAAIFPWGQSKQKGPKGEIVVSARAIKHVMELTQLVVDGRKEDDLSKKYDATVLFVVVRNDTDIFRPNHEACPSFTKYLKDAHDAGVQILSKKISWGEGDENFGKCYDNKMLEVVWPVSITSNNK